MMSQDFEVQNEAKDVWTMLKKHNFWYAMASLTSSNHKGSVNNCTAVTPSDYAD